MAEECDNNLDGLTSTNGDVNRNVGSGAGGISDESLAGKSIDELKSLVNTDIPETDNLVGNIQRDAGNPTLQYLLLAVQLGIALAASRGGAEEASPQRTRKANSETEKEVWDEETDGIPSEDIEEEIEDAPEEDE